jgi:hypothetical protein
MLTKESQLDYKTMRKSIEEYEKIKKTMNNNKRALSTNYIPNSLPTIGLTKSKVKITAKDKPSMVIKYEESPEDNPEFLKKTS